MTTDLAAFGALKSMLTYARPAYSTSENKFIRKFITPLGAKKDSFGNYILKIGDDPTTLWSCHTDTVHRRPGTQLVDFAGGFATLDKTSKHSCLGADDTAGIWLMCEMILAKKPGLYIFHAAEEIGGLGSSFIASDTPELLSGIKMAIALDRKGTDSVITHQGSRCCSDEFAWSLAKSLGNPDAKKYFKPDDGGLFTDTANYTGLVGECTNLSVGYDSAHSPNEYLDYEFLQELKERLIALDTNELVLKRVAGEEDDWGYGGGAYDKWLKHTKGMWPDDDDDRGIAHPDKIDSMGPMEQLVSEYPDIAAEVLLQCGVSYDELQDYVSQAYPAYRAN